MRREARKYIRPDFYIPQQKPIRMLIVNQFKITVRTLWKHKVPSFINIFGLTAGLCSCLLIAIYIKHQIDFDKFQPNKDRLSRVIMEYGFDGSPETRKGNFSSAKVAPTFSRTFPEVEAGVRMMGTEMIVRREETFFNESGFMFTDSTFFKAFYYEMLEGNPGTALNGPMKIVLTRSAAVRYFGDKSPLGETLLIGTSQAPYEVTGVIEDYPGNSQLKFTILASFSSLRANQEQTYFNANYTTYLLLRDNASREPLQEKITPFMQKEMTGSGVLINFWLEPFDEIHLHSPYVGFVPTVSAKFLYILGAVAVLILVIVCFTYINLSTARAIERAREVGVRKVVGAGRTQIFWQFIGESAVLSLLSIVMSIALVVAVLPFFNELTQQQLVAQSVLSIDLVIFCVITLVAITFLAGAYPAIVLAGFRPLKVLKGNFANLSVGKSLQHSLIIFQFVVTVFLIVATFVVKDQLNFIQEKSLSSGRDNLLVLPMDWKMLEDFDNIKNALKADHRVLNVARCTNTPVNIYGGYNMRNEAMGEGNDIPVNANVVDEEYIPATGLELIAGTNFTIHDIKDMTADGDERTYHFVLNESAARALGWSPEEAIGQKMYMGDHRPGFVRGVIKDFHFASMHDKIGPLVLFGEQRGHGHIIVKLSGDDVPGAISSIENAWKQRVPYLPFESHFLDEDFEALYRSELQLGTVMNIFSVLAIVLACLGLFGLSSFMGQKREKEMSVRKVLGASLLHILALMSRSFLILFIVAIVIALPMVYFMMNVWLQSFAYRVEISGWLLLISSALVIGVALFTVSIQALKTAMVNPAQTLKSE